MRNRGYILDGFPRNLTQALKFFDIEQTNESPNGQKLKDKLDMILVLNCSDEYLIQRMSQIPESDPSFKYDEKTFAIELHDYRVTHKNLELVNNLEHLGVYVEYLGNFEQTRAK